MDSQIKYEVTEDLRDEFKKPVGQLLNGEEFYQEIKTHDIIIAIGDHLCYSLLKREIYPSIIIVDYHTRRGPISTEQKTLLQNHDLYKTITVSNPPGVITEELWDTIKDQCQQLSSSTHVRIEVKGEEDLASLPAILFAPFNVTIIYGLPDKGVVVIKATDEIKDKVRKILTKM